MAASWRRPAPYCPALPDPCCCCSLLQCWRGQPSLLLLLGIGRWMHRLEGARRRHVHAGERRASGGSPASTCNVKLLHTAGCIRPRQPSSTRGRPALPPPAWAVRRRSLPGAGRLNQLTPWLHHQVPPHTAGPPSLQGASPRRGCPSSACPSAPAPCTEYAVTTTARGRLRRGPAV